MHASVDAYLALLRTVPSCTGSSPSTPSSGRPAATRPRRPTSVPSVAELVSQQLATSLAAAGLDPALSQPWGAAIGGFISAASFWWLDHPEAMTREELADYLASLLWGGAAGVYQFVGRKVDGRPEGAVFARARRPAEGRKPR